MEYTVISVDKSGENIKTLVDSLSEDAYESIMDSVGQLQTAMLSKDYIAITLENIRELKQCMNAIDLADRRSFQSINRYVYNILGVFYAWIEYWESNYKTTFAPVKKKYYDKYFEYRMMYNLRRYMTHCEMAVTQIECHFDKDEMFIYIEPEKLLQHPKQLQKVFIPELEDMVSKSQKIDLGSLISKFERLYTEMNQELLGNLTPLVQPHVSKLSAYIEFENGLANSSYIREKDTGKNGFGITSFLTLFVEKMMMRGMKG